MATTLFAARSPRLERRGSEDEEAAERVVIQRLTGRLGSGVGRSDDRGVIGVAHAAALMTPKASRSSTQVPSRSSIAVVIDGATLRVMAQR